jgi:hypothetical protein
MPDDHSVSVPPLPIPNRTVKRLHADDSADSRVKVGNRQAPLQQTETPPQNGGVSAFTARFIAETSVPDAKRKVSGRQTHLDCR